MRRLRRCPLRPKCCSVRAFDRVLACKTVLPVADTSGAMGVLCRDITHTRRAALNGSVDFPLV